MNSKTATAFATIIFAIVLVLTGCPFEPIADGDGPPPWGTGNVSAEALCGFYTANVGATSDSTGWTFTNSDFAVRLTIAGYTPTTYDDATDGDDDDSAVDTPTEDGGFVGWAEIGSGCVSYDFMNEGDDIRTECPGDSQVFDMGSRPLDGKYIVKGALTQSEDGSRTVVMTFNNIGSTVAGTVSASGEITLDFGDSIAPLDGMRSRSLEYHNQTFVPSGGIGDDELDVMSEIRAWPRGLTWTTMSDYVDCAYDG